MPFCRSFFFSSPPIVLNKKSAVKTHLWKWDYFDTNNICNGTIMMMSDNESYTIYKWASARWNLQIGICAQRRLRSAWASAQFDQSLRCAFLIGSLGPTHSSCGQRRFWLDWVHAQADLSLRCAHMSCCRLFHALAQTRLVNYHRYLRGCTD